MTQLKIRIAPDPILRQKSKPINLPARPSGGPAGKAGKIDRKTKKLVADLIDTAKAAQEPKGVGLSAVQIGKPLRIFVIKQGKKFISFINPKITFKSKKSLTDVLEKEKLFMEGCLSIPGYYGFVERPYAVKLKWLDLAGKTHQKKFEGKQSAYVQHELDHLNGLLFVDRLLEQAGKIYKLEKNKEDQEVFVEVKLA